MKSKIKTSYYKHELGRIFQGDILRDFEYPGWNLPRDSEDTKGELIELKIPYIVILTQDCDLESDSRNHDDFLGNDCTSNEPQEENKISHDKFLHSILVCPAYPAKQLKKGSHLNGLGLRMQKINSNTQWNNIKNNQNPRYHFLKKDIELQIPELIIDFKHYYTIPRDILYVEIEKHYLGSISELFREFLSQRFAFYLSRIGLPF